MTPDAANTGPPPPHLPPPASPSELSRLSALCLRCPCNSIPFQGLIPPPPSLIQQSAGSSLWGLIPILSAAASLRPPLGETPRLLPEGSLPSPSDLILDALRGANSVDICLSFHESPREEALARPLPDLNPHPPSHKGLTQTRIGFHFILFPFPSVLA